MVLKSWVVWWAVLAQGLSCSCSQMLARATIICSLDGAGGLTSMMTALQGGQVDADTLMLTGWQVSLRFHLGLSRRHLECLHDMAANFPQSKWSKRMQGRKPLGLLCYILRSHTLLFSRYPVGFMDQNQSVSQCIMRGLYKSMTTRK